MLDKLREMTDGNKERMSLYIATYKEGIGEYIEILRLALPEQNLERIRYVTHVSRPLFTLLGFTDIYKLASEIEHAIDSNSNLTDMNNKTEYLLSKMEQSLDSLVDLG